MTRQITYLQAIREAQLEEMRRDPRVIVMGEDVQHANPVTAGFYDEFGPLRVRTTPISENGFVGAAVGAALTGLRPIVDMTYAAFFYVAMDEIVSQAAKNRYMFGGQGNIPVVYRAGLLYGGNFAAHHSDRPYPMFMNVPGLKIIVPTTPYDMKGMLKAAIREDDPVLCFEDLSLVENVEEVPDDDFVVPLGAAAIRRSGTDVTVVGIARSVHDAVAVADDLAPSGVSVEVIDPRSLVPLDRDTILRSVAKTGRLVVVDPAHKTCSAASEIAALVAEEAFGDLKAPIVRVTAPDVQVPFSPALESLLYPTKEKIEVAVRRTVGIEDRVPTAASVA
jgi:pyruvate dehydrogenase E1 component beta subunit